MTAAVPMAAVFGCAGPELSSEEAAFFKANNPLGFILFARNCENTEQIRRLTDALRNAVERPDAPVLMDHEGGRVQRLPAPPWRKVPAAARFGDLANSDPDAAEQAVSLNGQLMAMELASLGIDVNCVPCLDVRQATTHEAIGDRAFSADPELVARLGRAQVDGVTKGGVLPVMKHMPGHGRANVDSHLQLPVVTADRTALADRDLAPFVTLSDLPLGMTGHVLFPAWDSKLPATLSQAVISQVIRTEIGFDGLLFTDDLSMQALGGTIGQRAAAALQAGCDVALHCNGKAEEMQSVAAVCPPLSDAARNRWQRAQDWRRPAEPADYKALLQKLNNLLGSV